MGRRRITPEPVAEKVAETADETEPQDKADQIERAVKEPEPEEAEMRNLLLLRRPLPHSPAAVPADTHHDPDGPGDGHLGHPRGRGDDGGQPLAGAGHYTGSGYPWVAGSNTYIAGHRLGYPGTPSDHVFWNLPNLAMGDEIYLTDSNGHTYTYAVSDILEVPMNDLSVTGPTGAEHGLAADLHRGLRGLLDAGPELERPLHRQGDDGL